MRVLAILAAPGLQVASARLAPPQAEGLRHRRLRGGTYATSATIRPLVGSVALRPSDAKRAEEAGCVSRGIFRLYTQWRSPRQETPLRRLTEIRQHAHPQPGMVFVTSRGKAFERCTSTKN